MSLSQKHSGTILVPWFNSAEWKYVANLVQSSEKENLREALKIMQIWKLRTPLLASGIEGSLIIIEALLTDVDLMSDEDLQKIYSLTIMRFLNVCAANSDRQGNFNKTLNRSDLPKWLINIRHDIAHSSNLPPKSILEMGLNVCFTWLKENYWQTQAEYIVDFVVNDENSNIIDILKLYIDVNLAVYNKLSSEEFDSEFIDQICCLLPKRLSKKLNLTNILNHWDKVMKGKFNDENINVVAKIIVDVLIKQSKADASNKKRICNDFKNLWTNLLDLISECGYLFNILNCLYEIVINEAEVVPRRQMAAIWILEIFEGLSKAEKIKEEMAKILTPKLEQDDKIRKNVLNIVNTKNLELKDALNLEIKEIPYKDAIKFEAQITEKPNVYTKIFLERVLQFNKRAENFTNVMLNMVGKFNMNWCPLNDPQIYTVFDLCKNKHLETPMELDKPLNSKTQTKWKPISEPELYDGLPLGILPNQLRLQNPLMTF